MVMEIARVELVAPGGLRLRPPNPSEAADALAMLRDPDVMLWNGAPLVVDEESAAAWCERGGDWSDGGHATFTVLDPAGRLAGNVSLHRIDWDHLNAEIGYRVAPWARGRGVATASLAAATDWALGELGLVRVQLLHAVENPASCRVAEKAGYEVEGTLRLAMRYGDGRLYDDHLHAKLSENADARR
jgi:RimJ/RimL family protein N-acetyltransferase